MHLQLVLYGALVFGLLTSLEGDCLKIIGGKEVAPHSKPYMAYLSIGCGAALIKEDWVLTAAHCFRLGEVAVLGAHSIKKNEKQQQMLQVKGVFMYPKYNCLTKQNDLMLMQLEKPATLNKQVSLLSLPSSGDDVSPGTRCNVAGWGATSFMGKTSDTLQEVNVTVIDRKLCNTNSYYNGLISKNMLCAGDKIGGKDSCGGDSGGPLICDGVYRGIVSFGADCGLATKPGVYTLLTDKYLKWIQDTISA
ncbi:granzyme A-like [Erpetoichthys calabaricus]|uniref:granzyme A-like n=1 Tax=Erpetoichthys calabaricus TaxID=27687 RepID=UPI00223439FE|nr:granzyme A-like [Erpetoichthys calabaricus]